MLIRLSPGEAKPSQEQQQQQQQQQVGQKGILTSY